MFEGIGLTVDIEYFVVLDCITSTTLVTTLFVNLAYLFISILVQIVLSYVIAPRRTELFLYFIPAAQSTIFSDNRLG